MTKLIEVHIEYPTGSCTESVEVEDDLTPEQIAEVAKELFFNECNYGYTVDGADPE